MMSKTAFLDSFVHASIIRLTPKQARDIIEEFDLEDQFNCDVRAVKTFLIAEYAERLDKALEEVKH